MANGSDKKRILFSREALTAVASLILGLAAVYYFARVPSHLRENLIGKPAPPIGFRSMTGNQQFLKDFKGKTVLINFWASWCSPCMQEMPSLKELEERLSGENFALLAINTSGEGPRVVENTLLLRSELPERLVFPGAAQDLASYNIDFIPLSVLMDSAGIVRKVYIGPRNWVKQSIIDEIREVVRQVH